MKTYEIKILGYGMKWTTYIINATSMIKAENEAFERQGINGIIRVETKEMR